MPVFLRRHPILAIFLASLAIRLANPLLLSPLLHGAWAGEGRSLLGSWLFGGSDLGETMPLYPLLPRLAAHLFGETGLVLSLLQALADAGSCAALAAMGVLILPIVGMVLGLAAILAVNLLPLGPRMLPESLFLLCLSLTLMTTARFLSEPLPRRAVAAGVASGLVAATRPELIWILPLLAVILAIAAQRKGGKPLRTLALTGLYAIAAAAPLVIEHFQ